MTMHPNRINLQQEIASASPIGRIVSVTGSQAIAVLNENVIPGGESKIKRPEMGTLVKISMPNSIVLGLVSALSVPMPGVTADEPEIRILEMELVGELPRLKTGELGVFRSGLTVYPNLGDAVILATRDELETAYSYQSTDAIKIGHILQDDTIASMVHIDDLLGNHFAILGTTGTGKSCAVALIMRNIIEKSPKAHIVLLDPHSEYASSFGNHAEVITIKTLNLPFWLLTFEEIVKIFVCNHPARETDIEILGELIPLAKSRYAASSGRERTSLIQRQNVDPNAYTVDTPVPYRISDLISLLDDNIGKLDLQGALTPFKRIKNRIEQFSRDPRYSFMFGNLTVQDTMVDILSQIFRIPVNGKPITIIDLAGLPSEVVNVTVSVLSRMTFDFGLWSDGQVPITLICEEAHRYVPNDASLGFEPTKRAISRIAKEGRKYGISLCVISQRPTEIDSTILSQCNTIFAMRLPNELDRDILRAAMSDAASSLLDFLPSLGNREAVAFGEGVSLPARIRFDILPEDAMPLSRTRQFSQVWCENTETPGFLEDIVSRWRARTLAIDSSMSQTSQPVSTQFNGQPAIQSEALQQAKMQAQSNSEQPQRRHTDAINPATTVNMKSAPHTAASVAPHEAPQQPVAPQPHSDVTQTVPTPDTQQLEGDKTNNSASQVDTLMENLRKRLEQSID